MRRVFRYMRVSTDKQAEHGYSLEAQDTVLRDYAAGHKLEIVASFVESESAFTSGKRPEFTRMCAMLRDNPDVRAVLCYQLDRLARNMTDYATLMEDLDVAIVSMTEGEVSDDENALIGGIHAVMARHYSRELSRRVTLGMATKAAKGLWPTSAPAGYRNVDRDGDKFIEDDPRTGPLVTRLFEKYASGASLTELEAWARGAGLVSSRGVPLARSSLHRILSNSLYYGVVEWRGQTYQGKHRPLVSRSLWDACQDRLHGRAQTREQKHRFPFRGLLTCGYCGCQITASLIKGRYVYYHCTHKKGPCRQPSMRAEVLADRLRVVTERVHVPAGIASELVSAYEAQAVERERERKARSIQAKAGLRRATDLRTKCYTDKIEGVLDEERWAEIDRGYQAQEEDARAEIARWSMSSDEKADRAAETFKLLDALPAVYGVVSDERRAGYLRALGSNYILTAENVVPVFRHPFDRVAKAVETGDWRSVVDVVQTASEACELLVTAS